MEQVNAELKDSALAHVPSGVFTANAAWLVLVKSQNRNGPYGPDQRPGQDRGAG
jgi:hypothetical protein